MNMFAPPAPCCPTLLTHERIVLALKLAGWPAAQRKFSHQINSYAFNIRVASRRESPAPRELDRQEMGQKATGALSWAEQEPTWAQLGRDWRRTQVKPNMAQPGHVRTQVGRNLGPRQAQMWATTLIKAKKPWKLG